MPTPSSPKVTSKCTRVSGNSLRIDVCGLVVPSFKNRKRVGINKKTKRPMLFVRKDVGERMETIKNALVFALLSASQTGDDMIPTAAALPSLIASLPRDDDWKILRSLSILSEHCEPGEEGFTITIERLP